MLSEKSLNLLHLFCPIFQKPEVGFKIKEKITFSKVTQLIFTLPNLIIVLSSVRRTGSVPLAAFLKDEFRAEPEWGGV